MAGFVILAIIILTAQRVLETRRQQQNFDDSFVRDLTKNKQIPKYEPPRDYVIRLGSRIPVPTQSILQDDNDSSSTDSETADSRILVPVMLPETSDA